MTAREILYLRGLGDGSPDEIREKVASPVRVAGLVVDKIDRIMHGMELGTAGMHNQVRQWAEQGWLAAVLDRLLDGGFRIFLTSDHGNVEAEGMGRPSEGNLADLRGERVRIYPDETLREGMLQKLPAAIPWPAIGLPDHFFSLLAPARRAFVKEGVRIVAHGSISVEELIVPLIQIERRGGMTAPHDAIGFSQRLRLEWLQYTANLVLAGCDRPAIQTALHDLLQDRLSVGGDPERGNRAKAITLLLRIWQRPAPHLTELHQAGLELLRTLPDAEQWAIHWGMAMAAYPFWGAVATQVGRLLNLQETVAAACCCTITTRMWMWPRH